MVMSLPGLAVSLGIGHGIHRRAQQVLYSGGERRLLHGTGPTPSD